MILPSLLLVQLVNRFPRGQISLGLKSPRSDRSYGHICLNLLAFNSVFLVHVSIVLSLFCMLHLVVLRDVAV